MGSGFFVLAVGGVKITNLPSSCDGCTIRADNGSIETVECISFGGKRRVVRKPGEMIFCSGDEDCLNSARTFKRNLACFEEILPSLIKSMQDSVEDERLKIRRHIHNLVELNGKGIQSIYAAIQQDSFAQPDRESLLSTLSEFVGKNPRRTSKLIVDLLKNENLKKVEFSVYNKIFMGESYELMAYPLHKIVLLVLNIFWDDLNEKDVRVHVGEYRGRVLVDFEALSAALTHIFGNAAKYILPSTHLKIIFSESGGLVVCRFEMISLRIGEHEVARIFENGYSGDEPKRLKREGSGLGLWIVKQLFESMGGDVRVQRDIDSSYRKNKLGINYEKNAFELRMRKD